MEIFGYEITRKKDELRNLEVANASSFVAPVEDDGTPVIAQQPFTYNARYPASAQQPYTFQSPFTYSSAVKFSIQSPLFKYITDPCSLVTMRFCG